MGATAAVVAAAVEVNGEGFDESWAFELASAGVGGGAVVVGKASMYCKERCVRDDDGKSEESDSRFQSGGSDGSASVRSIRSIASESTGLSSNASKPLNTPSALRLPPSDIERQIFCYARRLSTALRA